MEIDVVFDQRPMASTFLVIEKPARGQGDLVCTPRIVVVVAGRRDVSRGTFPAAACSTLDSRPDALRESTQRCGRRRGALAAE